MPDTGSLLFVLDSRLKGRKEPKKRKCSKHFDSGMAIDLRYNESFYVPSGPSAAFSLPLADALHGGYRVEAFEDDDQEAEAQHSEDQPPPLFGPGLHAFREGHGQRR